MLRKHDIKRNTTEQMVVIKVVNADVLKKQQQPNTKNWLKNIMYIKYTRKTKFIPLDRLYKNNL